ncbi:MAG TPA: glycosyltransferase [Pyrinomonadaceae bacterium]
MSKFSVIIPAYNEELYLPRLLDSIDEARLNFHGGPDEIEVIVANNASTDLTAEIAISRRCRVVDVIKRTIGAARNGGASIATGEILCFIDADSAIHPQTFNAVDAAMRSRKYIAGATGIHLERLSPGILFTLAVFILFVWLTGMDTGLVFCRREDFDAVGSYDDDRLYAEDVKLLWALRRLGRKRGQTLVRLKGVKALGSTRKFDRFGDWHYFAMGLRALAGFLTGEPNDREMADSYWYKPER